MEPLDLQGDRLGALVGELGEVRCFQVHWEKLVSPIREDLGADLVLKAPLFDG